jgi:hypothetical protein
MKKLATFGTAVLLIALVAWAGDDPWKSKDFHQWNENDTLVILNQSPFSKLITITKSWRIDGAASTSTNGQAPGEVGGLSPTLPGEHSPSTDTGQYSFRVAWYSSHTVRAAVARLEQLHQAKSDADAEKMFSSKMQDYIVLVQGADMGPFNKRPEKDFQGLAYLQSKKSKQRISPSKVEYLRGSNGTVSSVLFYFPHKNAAGEPTISPDEKGVNFVCPFEKTAIQNYFEPQKMVAKDGQDL